MIPNFISSENILYIFIAFILKLQLGGRLFEPARAYNIIRLGKYLVAFLQSTLLVRNQCFFDIKEEGYDMLNLSQHLLL